ncbi:extracellular solute-binding protein [Limnochorda pilosa]|uniref:Sugar ABC transporter substrate-binding protein n=1 Tax=Limnochorda pilosa TaxID=1555112 RepID=A0A0K2SMF4_LIMPI|nr:extracellular solute-binding protein [Limnochorda pilosa]BAS28296.1 sugar ABC transporter substrate-binding protein [Limnochorda pilosa]
MHAPRITVSLVLLLLAGLILAPAVPVSAQEVNLTFWSWRTEDQAAYDQFIQAFEAENPGIHVRFVPYKNTEYNTIVATALQAGSGPDIIHLRAYGGLEPLADAGYLMPMDDQVEALKAFNPDVLRGATNRKDGKVYGVPFALQTVQVLYNVRVFQELGLKEPQTWDELLQVAAALKKAGYIPFANGAKEGWTLETFFGAVGPSFYGPEFYSEVVAGETTFEDPRFKAAVEKMLELRPYLPESYMGVGYTDMQVMFAQELAGMMLAGSYELGTFAQMNPNLQVGVFPIPPERAGEPAAMTMYVDGSYGVNAATKHPEAALEFIRFLASREYGQMFADTLKQISAVPGTQPQDPVLAELVQLMEAHGTPYLMLTAFRYGQPSGSTLLQNELQGVFAGKLSVEQAARNIQKGLASWYEPFQ